MIDRNSNLALRIAAVARKQAELWRAHDRMERALGHEECLAFEQANDAHSAAWDELRSAVADFPADKQKQLWTEIDAQLLNKTSKY